jgi:uncharacterized protein YciI
MHAALICTLGPDVEARRLELRASHLEYIASQRASILFGGPTLSAEGRPERMLIILTVPDLAAAHAFVAAEPYSAHGVFETVEVRAWSQVLPEVEPGALERARALARSP